MIKIIIALLIIGVYILVVNLICILLLNLNQKIFDYKTSGLIDRTAANGSSMLDAVKVFKEEITKAINRGDRIEKLFNILTFNLYKKRGNKR